MIPDALMSCSFLLLGSGSSIYRLTKYSNEIFPTLLPQFFWASLGIGALGARSLFRIVYNFLWRKYPIDPLLIEEELLKYENSENIIDWGLSTFGIAAVVYSLYHHHNSLLCGTIAISSLTTLEVLCLVEKFSENSETPNDSGILENVKEFPSILFGYVTPLWIITNEIFGYAVGNNYFRLANVAFFISSVYHPDGFYQGWSIKNSVNDYMILIFVILSTEALCKV